MNTKSFVTLEKTALSEYLRSKDVSEELKREWCRIIKNNATKFRNKDFNEICSIIESLSIEGIDGDIVNMTAFTIAEDNNIEVDPGLAKCFMIYSKNQ